MKKIVCDLCGESEFVKVNGFFECQVCGMKYTIAEARDLFVEVDENGNVIGGKKAPAAKGNEPVRRAPAAIDDGFAPSTEDPVAKPKAGPTIVRKVVVQSKPASTNNSSQAVKRIVSNVQKTSMAREDDQGQAKGFGKPGSVQPTVKKVVVKPVTTTQRTQQVKPVQQAVDPSAMMAQGGSTARMIENFFILSQNAYDSQNYTDAENYANRIIELEPTNCDAWLMKGNCAGWQTNTPTFRLLESINCWNTCILNASKEEMEDYQFTVRSNCIEVAVAYVLRNITDFKKKPGPESIAKIKETIDFVEPMMRKANQTFGVELVVYEDKLASNISAIVNEVSKQATQKFGKKKEQQTDEAFTQFIETQDYCIEVWGYLMDLAKKHGTVTAILHSIVKMHETIIRSCGYKVSSNGKIKESKVLTLAERNQRLEKIKHEKKRLDDKFVDIRKRDRVEQKVKNAKYWEEHEDEKNALLEERSKLDHEIFELENSKLKMPELNELKHLEEEVIKWQVMKDNPTYSNKERAEFMDTYTKTKKQVVTKKRELASRLNPIEDKIEKLKKRMYNIDSELNMNR